MTNLELMRVDSIVSLLFSHFLHSFRIFWHCRKYFYCTCVCIYMPDDIVFLLLSIQFVYNKKIGIAMRTKTTQNLTRGPTTKWMSARHVCNVLWSQPNCCGKFQQSTLWLLNSGKAPAAATALSLCLSVGSLVKSLLLTVCSLLGDLTAM